jgi:predicted transcriptional regulator
MPSKALPFTIRLPDDVKAEVVRLAKAAERTTSQYLRLAITAHVTREKAKKKWQLKHSLQLGKKR